MDQTLILEQLASAEVGSQELNPLAYDLSEYPAIHDMLTSRQFNSTERVKIDLAALSKNGQLIQDPMSVYLNKKAVSSSALKEVLKTPFHYLFYKQLKKTDDDDDKGHFELGSFAHMAFIEPDRFNKYIIEPAASLAKKDDVIKLIRFYEDKNVVLNPKLITDDFKMNDLKLYLTSLKELCPYPVVPKEFQDIIDAIGFNYIHYGDGIIPKILKGAVGEVSMYTKDTITGLPVKIRPDFFNIEENIGVNAIISFKTTSATTLKKFAYDAAVYAYDLSEGMYQNVASHITDREFNVTMMIMLQTVAPFLCAVFWWHPDDLANGKYKYRNAMELVRECETKCLFPGFDAMSESGNHGIIELLLPEWSKKELPPMDIEK